MTAAETGGSLGIETRAAFMGVAAGMRSQVPIALLAWQKWGTGPSPQQRPPGLFGSPAVRALVTALAAGELVGDKLPATPSRLRPAPFLGRLAFGALAGGLLATRAGGQAMAGAAAGGTGAVIGTIAFGEARVALTRLTGLPDPLWAVAEDAVAVALGLAALRR